MLDIQSIVDLLNSYHHSGNSRYYEKRIGVGIVERTVNDTARLTLADGRVYNIREFLSDDTFSLGVWDTNQVNQLINIC